MTVRIVLSTTTISLAVHEAAFLFYLVRDFGQALDAARPPIEPACPAQPASVGAHYGASSGGPPLSPRFGRPPRRFIGRTLRSDSLPEPPPILAFSDSVLRDEMIAQAETPGEALEETPGEALEPQLVALPALKLDVVCEGGIWVHVVDDAEDALMPLYEAGVQRIEMRIEGALGEAREVSISEITIDEGGTALGMLSGIAHIAFVLQASHFNASNGHWEPVIEPWHLFGSWSRASVSRASAAEMAPTSSSTFSADVHGADETTTESMPHAQRITLRANESLDVNLTHAMLVSLVDVDRVVRQAKLRHAHQTHQERRRAQAAELKRATRRNGRAHDSADCVEEGDVARDSMDSVRITDDGSEATDDEEGDHESDDDGDEAQIKFMPCAVRNLTELELHFATSAAAAAAALPGRRNVFGSAR